MQGQERNMSSKNTIIWLKIQPLGVVDTSPWRDNTIRCAKTYPWTYSARNGSHCPNYCFHAAAMALAGAFIANIPNRNRTKLPHPITLHFHNLIIQNQSPNNLFNLLFRDLNNEGSIPSDQLRHLLHRSNLLLSYVFHTKHPQRPNEVRIKAPCNIPGPSSEFFGGLELCSHVMLPPFVLDVDHLLDQVLGVQGLERFVDDVVREVGFFLHVSSPDSHILFASDHVIEFALLIGEWLRRRTQPWPLPLEGWRGPLRTAHACCLNNTEKKWLLSLYSR